MGKASRDKGAREERAIVNTWQDFGLAAERVPLSGAAGGSYVGDVSIPLLGKDRVFEAKVRANGFKQIYEWLGDNFGLFIRSDRNPRLVVLREADLIEIIRCGESYRSLYCGAMGKGVRKVVK
jgi:hypothetical protein